MAGFNFGQIAPILSEYFDTDEIDVGRSEEITLPDGSETVTDPNTPKYERIPCHLSFNDVDNPNPAAVGSVPITHALTINCAIGVDLQNADHIWARKLSNTGTVLARYEGTIGEPVINQGRQSAVMQVRRGE